MVVSALHSTCQSVVREKSKSCCVGGFSAVMAVVVTIVDPVPADPLLEPVLLPTR